MRQVKLQKKINSAASKAKELGILNDKPKVKGTGTASSYQPSKAANDNAIRYRAIPATVSKPSASAPKDQNVPMGSGSKSKPSSSSESSYKNRK